MTSPPRPRAFRLDAAPPASPLAAAAPFVEDQPDVFAPAPVDAAEIATEVAQKRGFLGRFSLTWSGLLWSALGGLASLALGLWVTRLVDDLFARSAGFGWLGLGLAGLALLAAMVMLAREILALSRQRKIARLHKALAQARAADDRDAARQRVAEMVDLYAARPATAAARAELTRLSGEIVDGRDLIDIAERRLMQPLDAQARKTIAQAARRVSIVTAIAPRALVDVLFVAGQAVYLTRKIAEIYGGRPGFFGFLRLARSVGAHLAITGGMAVGDSLLQQIVGHGIAAKISARLGEGVLNGLLTARIGLSAMAVCRPMPFAAEAAPGVKDVAPELFSGKG